MLRGPAIPPVGLLQNRGWRKQGTGAGPATRVVVPQCGGLKPGLYTSLHVWHWTVCEHQDASRLCSLGYLFVTSDDSIQLNRNLCRGPPDGVMTSLGVLSALTRLEHRSKTPAPAVQHRLSPDGHGGPAWYARPHNAGDLLSPSPGRSALRACCRKTRSPLPHSYGIPHALSPRCRGGDFIPEHWGWSTACTDHHSILETRFPSMGCVHGWIPRYVHIRVFLYQRYAPTVWCLERTPWLAPRRRRKLGQREAFFSEFHLGKTSCFEPWEHHIRILIAPHQHLLTALTRPARR